MPMQDLEAYAAAHGLPAAYIPQFMDAVIGRDTRSHTAHSVSSCTPCQPADAPAAAAAANVSSISTAAIASTASPSSCSVPLGGGRMSSGGSGSGDGEAPELSLRMFERFVRSRESALRRAFNLFDKGEGVGNRAWKRGVHGHVVCRATHALQLRNSLPIRRLNTAQLRACPCCSFKVQP